MDVKYSMNRNRCTSLGIPLHGSFWRILVGIIVFIIAASTYKNNNLSLVYLANIVIYLLVLTGKPEDDFLLYVLITPITGLLPSSIFRVYICLIISIWKLLLQKQFRFSLVTVLSIIYFSLNFILFDYLIGGQSAIMTLLVLMIYILVLIDSNTVCKLEPSTLAIISLVSAFLILTVMFAYSKGSLQEYALSNNIQYRMGEETRALGGAMGISLYGCIAIACVYYIWKYTHSLMTKLAMIGICVYIVIVELLSLSRTFFISLLMMLVILIISRLKTEKRFMRLLLLMVIFCIVGSIVYYHLNGIISPMIDKLQFYFISGGSGRPFIWVSCLIFSLSHPLSFAFGNGTCSYMYQEVARSYAFYGYGAHCLFLDMLMSFGIIGFVLLILNYLRMYARIKNAKLCSASGSNGFVDFIPLIMFGTSQLFQGSFRDLQSYLFPIVMLILICKPIHNDKKESDYDNEKDFFKNT